MLVFSLGWSYAEIFFLILVKKCCNSRIYEFAVKSEGKELEKWLSLLGYAM